MSRFRLEHPGNCRMPPLGENWMSSKLLELFLRLQSLRYGEEGQDLVEYALLVALIALVCVTGVNNVASAVNTVFSNISGSLA